MMLTRPLASFDYPAIASNVTLHTLRMVRNGALHAVGATYWRVRPALQRARLVAYYVAAVPLAAVACACAGLGQLLHDTLLPPEHR